MTIGHLVSELAQTLIEGWHAEDDARANNYANAKEAKRRIDVLNQRRVQLIEQIDEAARRPIPAATLRLTREHVDLLRAAAREYGLQHPTAQPCSCLLCTRNREWGPAFSALADDFEAAGG